MMIEIFGTSNCAFCKDSVELCEAAKLDYKYTALDVYPDALEALEERRIPRRHRLFAQRQTGGIAI